MPTSKGETICAQQVSYLPLPCFSACCTPFSHSWVVGLILASNSHILLLPEQTCGLDFVRYTGLVSFYRCTCAPSQYLGNCFLFFCFCFFWGEGRGGVFICKGHRSEQHAFESSRRSCSQETTDPNSNSNRKNKQTNKQNSSSNNNNNNKKHTPQT